MSEETNKSSHELFHGSNMVVENPEDVSDRWTAEYHLEKGTTDRLKVDKSLTKTVPTAIQMGKVYARLIQSTTDDTEKYSRRNPSSLQFTYM